MQNVNNNCHHSLLCQSRAAQLNMSSFVPEVLHLCMFVLQMLQHVWTYKPLVHDVLSMHANSVTIDTKAEAGQLPGTTSKKRYEVPLLSCSHSTL